MLRIRQARTGREGLARPPAADEVFLAVGARGTAELSAEKAREVELVIEPAGGGLSAERRYDQKYTL